MDNRVDLSKASQSRTFINTHPDPIPPTSTLYIQRTSDTNAEKSENHTVTGMHLIFKAGEKNKLFDSFNVSRKTSKISAEKPKVAVKSLLIACDVLEIHGELSLPECDVSIYARKLILKSKGCINTSPLNWDVPKARNADKVSRKPGRNGAPGRHAGTLKVFVNQVETPASENVIRFIAKGGKGQNPGNGAHGKNGYSARYYTKQEYKINDSGIKTTYCKATFDPPAYYIEYEWRWGLSKLTGGKQGTNKPPQNGTDALAPGVPGNAGNGGAFTSNQRGLARFLDNAAGLPGDKPVSVTGGAAGTPTKSSRYKLKLWHNWAKKYGDVEKSTVKTVTTKKGKSYAANAVAVTKGKSAKPVTVSQKNSWLHVLQLQTVLSFVRDAYLGGERETLMELLREYNSALQSGPPDGNDTGAVWKSAGAKWQASQTEVATLLQRQVAQLDYFGNPAGYMPLLSLQSNMRLYDIETERALRTLLLAAWVTDQSNAAQSASKAFTDAIGGLQDENTKLVSQLQEAEETVTNSGKQLDSLQSRLDTMSQNLSALENKLYSEASDDLHIKGQIKFGIKMAAAICQVIPVGQPALGTVGKLGGIAGDLVDGEKPDTLSKMGDTIAKAKEASDKSKTAVAKAKKDGLYEKPSAVSGVMDGLGPALSLTGEAISALQVPESEIDAELERLKAESPEWNDMVDDITELNKDKAKIFNDLIAALQVVGEGYSRLANNADSIFVMRQQNNSTLARLNMDAIQVVASLGQKARIALQRALYLMVKSYETTVMKPITVNWKISKVLKGVNDLLKPNTGFDAKTINACVKALKPIFEDNLNTVKNKLLDQYGFDKEDPVVLEFGLTEEQTAEQLHTLNETGSLSLDPVSLGLILPGRQRMTLAGLELSAIEYDDNGPDLPASGNMLVSVRSDANSTVRVGDKLYVARSNAERPWTWTSHFSSSSTDVGVPSTGSLDLLNSILSSSDESIKQKLASPPLWSNLSLSISFTPRLAKSRRPRIKKLIFKATTNTWAAPTSQRVLNVRCVGAQAEIACAPNDLGGRGQGFGRLYRIYAAKAAVKLKAPGVLGNQNFSHWKVLNNDSVKTYYSEKINVTLDSHTWADCHYESHAEGLEEATVSSLDNPKLAKLALEQVGVSKSVLSNVKSYLESQRAMAGDSKAPAKSAKRKAKREKKMAAKPAAAQPGQAGDSVSLIRIAPAKNAQVVRAVTDEKEVTVLETKGGWRKVQFGGVVGYCKK